MLHSRWAYPVALVAHHVAVFEKSRGARSNENPITVTDENAIVFANSKSDDLR